MFRSIARGPRAALCVVVLAASAVVVPLAGSSPVTAAPPTPQPAAVVRPGTSPGLTEIWGGIGGRVVVLGNDGTTGVEPYVYDEGTGTVTLLRDIATGPTSSDPQLIARLGDRFVFRAAGAQGDALWATDGTVAGTVLVKDIDVGTSPGPTIAWDLDNGAPVVGGFVYLFADDGLNGQELWRTDGTEAGTTLVDDTTPGAGATVFNAAIAFAGRVYVAASVAGDPSQLWRTDGTSVGTELVEPARTTVNQLAVAGSTLLFTAEEVTGEFNRILYRTEGTPGAATPVQDPAGRVFFPDLSGSAAGLVYFAGQLGLGGPQGVWVSDGTSAGTVELRRSTGTVTMLSPVIVPYAGGVAFIASTPESGTEVWVSDGTPGGTRVVESRPGALGNVSLDGPVAHADGWLYFVPALPPVDAIHIARTDGTTLEQVTAEPDFGQGLRPASIGDRVYFRGVTSTEGGELWYVDAPPPVPSVAGAPVATAGVLSASVTWSASTALPAAPVTGYTVTAAPGGATCSTTGALSCTVIGLTAGTSYTFTVVATNRIGSSVASTASNAVVPTAPPVVAAPPLVSVVPARILETRSGADLKTVDRLFEGIGRQAAGSTLELTVAGRANVPADASAVMVNVTAVGPDAAGFLTVFPCGTDQPNASSVNYRAGQVVPNAVLAKIGTAGKVCIFTTATTDLLADVNGFVPVSGSPATLLPARLLETRSGTDLLTVDGQFQGGGRVVADGVVELVVAGRGNVPVDATAVMLNVTAVDPDGFGFLTVYPCGENRPRTSSVNYQPGQVVPNAVLAKIGAGGKVCIYTFAATDVLVDVNGFVPAGSKPTPLTPARLLETRSGDGLETVDGQFQGGGRVAAGGVVELPVAGRGNVPADASAVMLNVTAVAPDGPGFVTVFPCGEQPPAASSVNYQAGQVVPNAVLAKIGGGGKVCLFTLADADLLVDVTGWT